MKRRTLIFIFMSFLSLTSIAQKEKLRFLEESYDYGTINEQGGEAKHIFRFINEDTEAVKIRQATASCGCTTPQWQRDPIFPGDTGYVTAIYNPQNRPGIFNKTISVFFENSALVKTLTITGFVQLPLTDPHKLYKDRIGYLKFKSLNFNMGTVDKNDTVTKIFNVFNHYSRPMTVEGYKLPPYVKIVTEPYEIPSNMVGNIRITYFGTLTDKEFGMVNDKIQFKTNDTLDPIKQVNLNAELMEIFSDSMKTDPNRPIISLEPKEKYLGSVVEGAKIKSDFKVKNVGKTDLYIRKMYSSCDCLVYKGNKSKLKPGEELLIKVEFDSAGKTSFVANKITIISNDPNAPVSNIDFRAKVTENTAK